MNHLNLTPEVNAAIGQSEIEDGVFLKSLPVSAVLSIETQSRTYTLEKRSTSEYFISGHPKYCPSPTLAYIAGSRWGGSMVRVAFVGRGMRLEFSTDAHGGVLTSAIREITEVSASRYV